MARKVPTPSPSYSERLSQYVATCTSFCANTTFEGLSTVFYYASVVFFVAFITLPFRPTKKACLSLNAWYTLYVVDFTILLHLAFELDEKSKMFKRIVGLTAIMGLIGAVAIVGRFLQMQDEAREAKQKQIEDEKRRKEDEEEKRLVKEKRRAAKRESMIREGSVREGTPGL